MGERLAKPREIVLGAGNEYRFELDPGTSLGIKLVRGQAEIFGAELVDGKTYLFYEECKAAVFTWQGCILEIGQPSTDYASEETPMNVYGNVHMGLEAMRILARRKQKNSNGHPQSYDTGRHDSEPPRVLILGPENSGKTTIAKILVNWATRTGQDWSPMLVNIDPGEGASMLPGTISAAAVSAPLQTSTPAHTLGRAATTAPTHMASNALTPLAYWYGHSEVRRNPLLLDRLIRNLGENVWDRLEDDPVGRVSGIIVDTPAAFAANTGGNADHRQALIKACVDSFRINVILVVGHEKLSVEVQRTYEKRMKVIKVPKSGGVADLDAQYRARIHKYQMHSYFYGERFSPPVGMPPLTSATATRGYLVGGEQVMDFTLAPASFSIPFTDLTIWRIGEETMAPSSALPIGATRVVSEMQPIQVNPAQSGSGLYNAVLALLAPPNPDESERYDEEVLDLHVVGFIIVTGLDIQNKKMTVLAPRKVSLAGRTAIIGSFEWEE